MKLAIASIALALLLQGGNAQEDNNYNNNNNNYNNNYNQNNQNNNVGQCLSLAASGYGGYGNNNQYNNQYENEDAAEGNNNNANNVNYNQYNNQYANNEWSDNAAYYANANNVEYSVITNLANLAETLGIELEDANESADGETNMYQNLATAGHVSHYDEEEARALGIEDEDAFELFYTMLYTMALHDGLSTMRFDEADADAEDYDEDVNELNEAINSLSLHVRIEAALDSLEITSADCANAADDNYASILETLGIREDELDDDTMKDIQVKLAVKSGALQKYLSENAAYGTNVDNWETLLENFFASIGVDDYTLDDIDSYIAADIYNIEYEVEELGCEAAMVEEYGVEEAKNLGYIVDQVIAYSQNSLSTGSIVGIAVGLVAAVGVVAASLIAFRGKSKEISDKETPLGYHLDVEKIRETIC